MLATWFGGPAKTGTVGDPGREIADSHDPRVSSGWQGDPNLSIEVKVRAPDTTHAVWGLVLTAWLSRHSKSPREQALKARLRELIRSWLIRAHDSPQPHSPVWRALISLSAA